MNAENIVKLLRANRKNETDSDSNESRHIETKTGFTFSRLLLGAMEDDWSEEERKKIKNNKACQKIFTLSFRHQGVPEIIVHRFLAGDDTYTQAINSIAREFPAFSKKINSPLNRLIANIQKLNDEANQSILHIFEEITSVLIPPNAWSTAFAADQEQDLWSQKNSISLVIDAPRQIDVQLEIYQSVSDKVIASLETSDEQFLEIEPIIEITENDQDSFHPILVQPGKPIKLSNGKIACETEIQGMNFEHFAERYLSNGFKTRLYFKA